MTTEVIESVRPTKCGIWTTVKNSHFKWIHLESMWNHRFSSDFVQNFRSLVWYAVQFVYATFCELPKLYRKIVFEFHTGNIEIFDFSSFVYLASQIKTYFNSQGSLHPTPFHADISVNLFYDECGTWKESLLDFWIK